MSEVNAALKSTSIKIDSDRIAFNIIAYIVLGSFALLCVLPFYIIIVASFTNEQTIMREGYSFFIRNFSTEGYKIILKNPATISRAYLNTICITIIGTAISVFFVSMCGYVLQKRDFPWRRGFMLIFYFTMLFNGGLTPYYILCTRYLGFKNQFYSLILPQAFSVWNMIIAKNFMRTIPEEIPESAKIDGAGEFLIFIRLILPLAIPLLATLGLFTALAYWNDWYNCMLFIDKTNMFTLQYFLQEMLNSIENLRIVAEKSGLIVPVLPSESMKMAMTIVVTGPIILVYPFLQRYFIKGLTIGAVKG
ncbi:MAG: carbohydrate ABC transporter permease [Clostridiales bacterium]|jgi:putative aldouronate transport system permease protein|nr:carbohydrate ABC transporter permease [Clostridiales bacterium]